MVLKVAAIWTLAGIVIGAASAAGPPIETPIVFATAARIPDIAVRTGPVVRRLTRNDWYDGLPAWSPDRKRIAYVSARDGDSDIWLMNADGSGARRVTGARRADDLYPTWSPDGKLIAFSRFQNGSGHVYVVRPDGKALRRLTTTAPGVDNTMPTFSPDGRQIVLASTGRSGSYQLVRVRASDGGGTTFITGDGIAMAPDYAPDGKRLVFVTQVAGEATLWSTNSDGGDRRALARYMGQTIAFPRFSPDGRFVLYTVRGPADDQAAARLWRVGADGTRRAEIGPGAEGDW